MGLLYQISLVISLLVCSSSMVHGRSRSTFPVDLTHGFTQLPLNSSHFTHHKPYDVDVTQRYRFEDGVHRLWVYSTDKPLKLGSPTKPRSEIRIEGYDYSSGIWQFEGHGYVPRGTSGVCIMQLFGADPPHATTLMVRTYNGSLAYYRTVVVPHIWDRWFKLNVVHDVEASDVKVYIDGCLVQQAPGRGGSSHYFKFGVYAQDDDSYYMESRWKGIRVLRKA